MRRSGLTRRENVSIRLQSQPGGITIETFSRRVNPLRRMSALQGRQRDFVASQAARAFVLRPEIISRCSEAHSVVNPLTVRFLVLWTGDLSFIGAQTRSGVN